ncbi:MAG: DUF3151 family protein, partial [Ilumatobacteraceae bacterium]
MTDLPVQLTAQGPPSTVLPPESQSLLDALDEALTGQADSRRTAVAALVAANPRSLAGWRALGDCGRDDIERYAAYRVGYHRGLDALRANGWTGSGYVRWSDSGNRGLLGCMRGL